METLRTDLTERTAKRSAVPMMFRNIYSSTFHVWKAGGQQLVKSRSSIATVYHKLITDSNVKTSTIKQELCIKTRTVMSK